MTAGHDRPADPPEPAAGSDPGPAASRARRHRRAVGGTRPADEDGAEPRAPRAAEDTDAGWGDRPDGDDDERFLREVPPHW